MSSLTTWLRDSEWGKAVALAAAVAAGGAALIALMSGSYQLTFLLLTFIYGIALVGMDVQLGYANQFALTQPLFMTVGAYTTAAVHTHYGWGPWAGLAIGLVITVVSAAVLGYFILRTQGPSLALVTFFLLIIAGQLIAASDWLGADNGMLVPPLNETLALPDRAAYLVLAVLVVTVFVSTRLVSSGWGLEVHVLAEDEPAARSIGINVRQRKVEAFVFGAVTADIAGFLFAHTQLYISPEQFGVAVALSFMLMHFLGGRKSIIGGLLGAFVLQFLPTYSLTIANNLLLFQGAALTLVLIFAGDGLVGVVRDVWERVAARGGRAPMVRHSPPSTSQQTAAEARPVVSSRNAGLAIRGLSRSFGGVKAVRDVSFEMDSTGIVALLGPNGAGKTTLFSLVSGLGKADSGTVTALGGDVSNLTDWQRARRGLARTFQLVRLPRTLRVLDNVASGARCANTSSLLSAFFRSDLSTARRKALSALEEVGMERLRDVPTAGLTLADQRFTELARALASDPKLLLLDEPASGLSDEQRQELAEILRRVSGRVPILLIEHDLDFIAEVTDRVVVMALGEVIYDGPMADLSKNERVAEAYLGSAVVPGGDVPAE